MTLARPENSPADAARVLVAEDNRLNSLLITEQLRLLGFLPTVVANGQEALARWRGGEFALLLTDLNMPDMDGYALASAIRAEEGAGKRIPIIALTADAFHGKSERWRAAGIDAYLTKPLELTALKTALEHWVRHGAGVAEVPTAPTSR